MIKTTVKDIVEEMKNSGFLKVHELEEFLEFELLSDEEIKSFISDIKKVKDYQSFLNGEFKKCRCCKNLFTYDCFYTNRNECKTCHKDRIIQSKNRNTKERREYKRKNYKKNKRKITKRKRRANARQFLERHFNKKFTHDVINKFVAKKYSKDKGYYNNKTVADMLFNKEGELK